MFDTTRKILCALQGLLPGKDLKMEKTIPKYILIENRIKQAIKQREITDKLPGAEVKIAEEKFKEISAAYELLQLERGF